MHRIGDEYLRPVLFLYQTMDEAKRGEGSGGSGFLVSVPSTIGMPNHVYGVTNRHVAEACSFLRGWGVTSTGEPPIFVAAAWRHHAGGDDVSITRLGFAPDLGDPTCISHAEFLTRDAFDNQRFGPGDDVFMTGRFVGLDGTERNAPTVRFGELAMGQTEPVWNSYRERDQESFVVEMHSQSGYSGSPVHIVPAQNELWMTEKPPYRNRRQGWLLGINWGHFKTHQPTRDPKTFEKIKDEAIVQENSGVELVVPAWTISALLMEDGVAKERSRNEAELEKRHPSVATTDIADQPELTKADFENALRKVSRRKPSQPDEGTSGTSG